MTEKEEINLKELLDMIIEKRGPYKRDQLEHAESVIEQASKNAQIIKDQLIEIFKGIDREGQNGESSDCAASAAFWYYQLKGEPQPDDY